jgi:uncharacterized coiled-coil protein SlyX
MDKILESHEIEALFQALGEKEFELIRKRKVISYLEKKLEEQEKLVGRLDKQLANLHYKVQGQTVKTDHEI